MEITRLLTKRVELRLGDDRWPLLLTHRVLLGIESELGVSILNGELDIAQLSAKALRTCLFVALSHSGAKYSARELGSLIGLKGIGPARTALQDAWIASMPEAEPSKSKAQKKSQPKRRVWTEVWANNRYHLHLSDDEWLSFTPRMVQALDRQRREDHRKWELMISRVAATSANYGFCRPKKALRDDTFMNDPWELETVPETEFGWDLLLGVPDVNTATEINNGKQNNGHQ